MKAEHSPLCRVMKNLYPKWEKKDESNLRCNTKQTKERT